MMFRILVIDEATAQSRMAFGVGAISVEPLASLQPLSCVDVSTGAAGDRVWLAGASMGRNSLR